MIVFRQNYIEFVTAIMSRGADFLLFLLCNFTISIKKSKNLYLSCQKKLLNLNKTVITPL